MNRARRLNPPVAVAGVALVIAVSLAASQTPRMPAAPTAASPADANAVKATVDANTAFAMDLYQVLLKDHASQNLFLSPFSISTVLGLVTNGARGASAAQMRTLLHISSLDAINAGIAAISRQLSDTEDGRRPYQLYTANAIWGSARYPVVPAFNDLSQRFFGTDGIRPLNFAGDPDGARATINAWVDDQTKTKIRNLLPTGSITPITAVVLTNAIYFKGAWRTPFEPRLTTPQPFHVTPQRDVQAAMMTIGGPWQYFEDDDVQAVTLPYKSAAPVGGATVSMLIVLPKKIDGLANVERSLTPGKVNEWIQGMQRRSGSIDLPKFTIAGETLNLTRTLPAMGMVDAFNQKTADFRALVIPPPGDNVYISGVYHKAFVDVNEEGTEAAAATAVGFGGAGRPQNVFTFRADHPFLFVIRYEPTNSILFMGHVTEPPVSAPATAPARGRGPAPGVPGPAMPVPQAKTAAIAALDLLTTTRADSTFVSSAVHPGLWIDLNQIDTAANAVNDDDGRNPQALDTKVRSLTGAITRAATLADSIAGRASETPADRDKARNFAIALRALISPEPVAPAQQAVSQPIADADAWGDPVDGVQLRLSVSKSAPLPLPGELPHFEMQIRNLGKDAVTYSFDSLGSGSDLEIDGVWYSPGPSAGNAARQPALLPGAQSGIIHLSFQSFRVDGKVVTLDHLGLRPGKHSVCVRTPGDEFGVENSAHQVLTLVSNWFTIDVTDSLALSAQRYQRALQVSLVPEKTSFMVREPMYLSFTVSNGSSEDLQVVVGNDTWNVLGRPERFTMQIVRDDGVMVPIRELPPDDVGGNRLSGPQKIPAGGSYSFSLFLPDWVEFKEPGRYTITAARTLDVRAYSQNDMSWTDPATLVHLDEQASAKITVAPFNRPAFGEVILARSRVMLSADAASEVAARAAATALATMDDDRVIEPFSRAVAESGYSVKFIVVGALAKFSSDAALAALRLAARDRDDNIRLAAAFALLKSPHPGAIDALLALRTDTSWSVRHVVLEGLARMQSADSLELIRAMTNDADEHVRTEAQRYLTLRTEASTPALASPARPRSAQSPNALDAIAWYDTLGFPDAKGLPYVRVATGRSSQSANQPPENTFVEGFLVREDAGSFTVFLCNVSAFTTWAWAEEIGSPAPLTIVQFTRKPSGPAYQQVGYEVLDFRKVSDDVLDRVRKQTSRPEGFLLGRPVTHRVRIFAFARACLQRGLVDVGAALVNISANIPIDQTGKVEPARLREVLQREIGDAVLTQAEVDAGNPTTSWAELLKVYGDFEARFPASDKIAYAREAADALRRMITEDANHHPQPLEQMSPADQVAENIYQLRNLRLIFAYWTDGSSSQYPVFPVDVRDSRDVPTPVHRLIDLGNAAVPQLIDALDDRTFTRTMVPSFNGRDLPHAMRVSDFARNILEFMSGRIPGGKMTREQAEAWWADVQSKGESEKQQLIDRAVVGGGTGSLNAAHKLVEKYPDAAIDAIAAGIRTTSNEGVRGAYVEIAGTLPGDASLAFLRSKLTPDVGVPSQIAAARALFARGQPEALPAMIDAWRGIQSRLPIDGWDFDWAAGGLITFLARSGDAGAIDALGHDLRRAPVDVRLAVVEVFLPHRPSAGSTGPSVQVYADMTTLPAGAAGAAIERLLVASLDDRERRLSMNGTYDEAIFTDPRVCDMAALTLSKRWPEKYTFHWSADAADCDAQIDKIRAKWIRESSVTLRTSGFELQT